MVTAIKKNLRKNEHSELRITVYIVLGVKQNLERRIGTAPTSKK